MRAIFKAFIDFVTTLLLFLLFWFFGPKACGVLAPWPGIKLELHILEEEVLTTGQQGKSLQPLLTARVQCSSEKVCTPLPCRRCSVKSYRVTESMNAVSEKKWDPLASLALLSYPKWLSLSGPTCFHLQVDLWIKCRLSHGWEAHWGTRAKEGWQS